MWSECIPYSAHVVRLYPMCCINRCCLHDQYVLPMWSDCIPCVVSIGAVYMISMYCPCGQSVSHIVPHVVRVYPMYCINRCCLHDQYVLPMWSECIPYSAHVAGMSHRILYQSMLSTWSVCIAHVVRVCPMWSECIPYIASIYAVYMISMYCPRSQSVPHIVPMWSECIPYIASIYAVYMIRMYCPRSQSVSYIVPMWSECILYSAHVVGAYPI